MAMWLSAWGSITHVEARGSRKAISPSRVLKNRASGAA
jgi:hypothetical protein